MSIMDMWKANALRVTVLILLNLALASLNRTAWIVLGLVVLLGSMFLAFRQGTAFGHEACALLDSVQSVRANDPNAGRQLDRHVLSRTFGVGRGIRALLASALIPYAASCVYLIAMLLKLDAIILPARLVALVLAMPFWPVLACWFQAFDQLHPAIVALLMVSPFVLPGCLFAGYMQGPRLWRRSEQAMAQGLRRAKAKSRIAKKRPPKAPKPEI